ncbi:phosphonate metabolism protein PhnK [Mangrovactinospora gilvigrisea]|uniref:Phosphonate metabolism protein PhnK n=1 Tax=Mangrovactinospora gilvigrisea TaxID=1428644 RepID=A0A1J7BG33_9ACTN|nr:ABC transporter ATP-binding protein [Mangrovactinospora gilvigrisea]OIV37635.1 phosphonate metabolism protein PhnK [Mangrovactinospora gilvigrisea]
MGSKKKSSAAERPKAPAPLLRLHRISRTYGDREALLPLSLDLPAGRCVALYGHNGSGKSTMLRIASGRDKPTTGTVEFDGRPMDEDDPEVRARVAVVGDTVACYPDLTVREHLELVTVAHGVADAAGWIDQVLEDRRLADHGDALPSSLSSGQMQSLLLAAALVRPRDLLVLDEPEQRLDPGARRRLAELLVGEKEDGVAVLLATHHPELAEEVADRMIALEDGRVIADGKPAAVLAQTGIHA